MDDFVLDGGDVGVDVDDVDVDIGVRVGVRTCCCREWSVTD